MWPCSAHRSLSTTHLHTENKGTEARRRQEACPRWSSRWQVELLNPGHSVSRGRAQPGITDIYLDTWRGTCSFKGRRRLGESNTLCTGGSQLPPLPLRSAPSAPNRAQLSGRNSASPTCAVCLFKPTASFVLEHTCSKTRTGAGTRPN